VGRLSRREVSVTDQRLGGIVVAQDPEAGTEVPIDVPVTVTVGVFHRSG
jgi:beta-lactam-binding protein with PASTA domain